MRYCFAVGLYRQGLLHDLSKFGPTEFSVGVRYYQGNRSPNNAEREDKGLTTAWLHHKGRNKHHCEYWIDYDLNREHDPPLCGMKMPKRYVVEMALDRIAASQIYKGEEYDDSCPLEYFLAGKAGADSFPKSYREQLVIGYKQFMAQQEKMHHGIHEIRIVSAKADTLLQCMNVFLVFCYGDSTNEQVAVPMVEYHGAWRMK